MVQTLRTVRTEASPGGWAAATIPTPAPSRPFHNFSLWTSCFERSCVTNKLRLLSNNKYISPRLIHQGCARVGAHVCLYMTKKLDLLTLGTLTTTVLICSS